MVCGAPDGASPTGPGVSASCGPENLVRTLPSGMTLSVQRSQASCRRECCAPNGWVFPKTTRASPDPAAERRHRHQSRLYWTAGLPDWINWSWTSRRIVPICWVTSGSREIAALFVTKGVTWKASSIDVSALKGSGSADNAASISIEDASGSPRYFAHRLSSVTVGPSPLFYRLAASASGRACAVECRRCHQPRAAASRASAACVRLRKTRWSKRSSCVAPTRAKR